MFRTKCQNIDPDSSVIKERSLTVDWSANITDIPDFAHIVAPLLEITKKTQPGWIRR